MELSSAMKPYQLILHNLFHKLHCFLAGTMPRVKLNRSFTLAHSDNHSSAFAQPAGKFRKIAVTGYQTKAFQLACIQQFFFPTGVIRTGPIPLYSLICYISVFGQLVQYRFDIFCRYIIRINQQCKSVFHVRYPSPSIFFHSNRIPLFSAVSTVI